MPGLLDEVALELDNPISTDEFLAALKTMKIGKAPGQMGIHCLVIRHFQTYWPRVVSAFNSLRDDHTIPDLTLQVHVTVIPKEGKDPAQCASYCLISLLNVEQKIFIKILANRLLPHIRSMWTNPVLLPLEKAVTKFNGCWMRFTMPKALSPLVLFSADAEKAFERVDWIFLRPTPEHKGLGMGMWWWLDSFYSTPSARVKVNEVLSEAFQIHNGTRQGCPLSQLVFILTLEPLLRTIRAHPDIKGIKTKTCEHKLAAYADDLIFFTTSPIVSLPSLLSELNRFGQLSNYKIYFSKSEAVAVELSTQTRQQLSQSFNFTWMDSHIRYLSKNIPRNLGRVFELHFSPLLRQFKLDICHWDKETFTWFGRSNVPKMNVMPHLIYLFQSLPIKLPHSFLSDLHSLFGQAHPLETIDLLCLSLKFRGGVWVSQTPVKYYEASHLTRIMEWCVTTEPKLWVDLEQATVDSVLAGLPRTPLRSCPPTITQHPTVGVTLQVTRLLFRTAPALSPSLSSLTYLSVSTH